MIRGQSNGGLRVRASLLFVVLVLVARLASGQPGAVDMSFDPGSGIGNNLYANVRCFAELPDGKLLIGGVFTTYNGSARPYLGRVFPNGDLDFSFNPVLDSSVECIARQPDGQILIGGDFSSVAGMPRSRIARLNDDGTLDTTFHPGLGANSTVSSMVLQPDGKLVAGGPFTNFDGTVCRGIVRLNSTGTIDSSFSVDVEPVNWLGQSGVAKLVALPNGKLFLIGTFDTVNGVARTNLARLLQDGSVDSEFDPARGPVLFPRAVTIQADGRAVIANSYYSIVRLNTDGSRDASFNGGRGELSYQAWVDALALQHDGKIVVVGYFTQFDGFPRNKLARLNSDGTFDWSFHSGAGAENPTITTPSVLAVHVQQDDSILLGGTFSLINKVSRRGIARLIGGNLPSSLPSIVTQPAGGSLRRYQPLELRVDGSSFETPAMQWRRNGLPIPGATNRIFQREFVQPGDAGDYTVVLRNSFGAVTSVVAAVTVGPIDTGPGSLDVTYHPAFASYVSAVTVDLSDRVLVGAGGSLQRLQSDGSLDSSFNVDGPILGLDGEYVNKVAIRPDGRLVIGGFFVEFDGLPRENITRLDSDGTTDPGFVPQPGPSHSVLDLALDDDGKVVVVGGFWQVNGKDRRCIARLNADGSLDEDFNIGTGSYSAVRSIVRQPDGKFIIGGEFTSFNEVAAGRLARLNPNGSIDATFATGTGAGNSVFALALQPDGKVLVGGIFTNFAGTTRLGLLRLNSNGTLDPSFAAPFKMSVRAMVLQPDGKVIVGGSFETETDPIRRSVVRLQVDGSVDEAFAPGIWMDREVSYLGLQSDGRVIIGGGFTTVNGYPRTYLARLHGDQLVQSAPLRIREYSRLHGGAFRLQISGTPAANLSVLRSTDLTDWQVLGVGVETEPGLFEFIDQDAPVSGSRFYQARAE